MDTELTWVKRATMSRLFSACLLLAVFFLPLHFHATSAIASQLTKECICLHGSRIQAHLTSLPAVGAPVIVVFAVAVFMQLEFDSRPVGVRSSRAPPA
jgi:hypothetical protein